MSALAPLHPPTWAEILAAIPSKHLGPDPGFRRVLAEFVRERTPHPCHYLEVGTRLGHSLAVVLAAGAATATSIDAWIPDYAEEPNPGRSVVAANLRALKLPVGRVTWWEGSSHDLLPKMHNRYDLILIDGDHTAEGAAADLRDALPLLAPGGLLVFDDLTDGEGRPTWLLDVWWKWAYALPAEYTTTTKIDVPFGWGTARRLTSAPCTETIPPEVTP